MKNPDKTIQSIMLSELQSKHVFERAQRYGLSYIDALPRRNVYPTEQALSDHPRPPVAAGDGSQDVRIGCRCQEIGIQNRRGETSLTLLAVAAAAKPIIQFIPAGGISLELDVSRY